MDNTETMGSWIWAHKTQDEDNQNTKTKKMSNTDPPKSGGDSTCSRMVSRRSCLL